MIRNALAKQHQSTCFATHFNVTRRIAWLIFAARSCSKRQNSDNFLRIILCARQTTYATEKKIMALRAISFVFQVKSTWLNLLWLAEQTKKVMNILPTWTPDHLSLPCWLDTRSCWPWSPPIRSQTKNPIVKQVPFFFIDASCQINRRLAASF